MYDVFISYARKDGLEFAERLERDLTVQQYRTWRDKRNLDVYQDFTAEIEIGIREARFVVVCVSPSIEQNPYSFVRREISYARSKNKPIIPLVLPNADLPLDIINLTWVGCFAGQKPQQTLDYEGGLATLLTRLQQNGEPDSRPAESLDPFREYVETLYDGIVDILNQTLIKLIDVRGQATPEAVQGQSKKPNPLAAFKGRYGMKPDAEETPIAHFREAYERYRGRVLLLGEPGAGKSTTLLAFARDLAAARLSDPTQPLPLLARCAMWDSAAQTPIGQWVAETTGLSTASINTLIEGQKAVLLLDALDELGNERAERKKTADGREIEERYDPRLRLLPLLPSHGSVVISCRRQDYAELSVQLPLNGAVTLQPLTDEQIQDYLSDFPDLWQAITVDTPLLEIARTPLLLSFIAFAFRDAPMELLPRGLKGIALRNFIFERYVQKRYKYEEDRNETALPFTLHEVYEVLGHVAMINASGDIRRGLYSPILENILMKRDFSEKITRATRMVQFIEFVTHLRLLVPIDIKIFHTMRFIHLMLRDYFVYTYCLPNLENENLYTEYYEPNPAKALGMIADDTLVINLAQVLNHPTKSLPVREGIAAAFGIAGLDSSIPALQQALRDLQPTIRYRAAEALGKLKATTVITDLSDALQDENIHVRISVIHALENIGTPTAVRVLQKALHDTTLIEDWVNVRVCDVAVMSLSRVGSADAQEAVQAWLQQGGKYLTG
jgi:DNA polymerase III delta prime subunit